VYEDKNYTSIRYIIALKTNGKIRPENGKLLKLERLKQDNINAIFNSGQSGIVKSEFSHNSDLFGQPLVFFRKLLR